jgi:putative flippase GtrA
MTTGPPRPAAAQFLRFALVGAAGFLVDAGALTLAMKGFGLGPYAARAFSYFCAATFTWFCNRHFTFANASGAPAPEWLRFMGANALGGALNYGVYAALVAFSAAVAAQPVLGVAAGSIAGLAFNFAASKRWVFRAGERGAPS